MPPKRKNKKTAFSKRKIKKGVPPEVMAAETKIQKTILDFITNPGTNVLTGNGWTTPYMGVITPASSIDTGVFNRDIYNTTSPTIPKPMWNHFGSFVLNGDERDQRNGRRITMLTSVIEMIFHFRAVGSGSPPVYKYTVNPEIRIVQGWVKGGLDSLEHLEHDITGLYSEIPFARYMIKYDKVVSRRAIATGLPPEAVASYASFKYVFKWKPNRRLTFSESVPLGNTAAASNCRYDGWTPFLYILNPHTNLELVFDNYKLLNLYKDL
jgi:hypothetical protein